MRYYKINPAHQPAEENNGTSIMNAETMQSLCAAVLLAGFLLVGIGGWGTYHFGLESSKEKAETAILKEQQLNGKLSMLEQTNEKLRNRARPLEASTSQLPEPSSEKITHTPAAITRAPGPAAPKPASTPFPSVPPQPKTTPALIASQPESSTASPAPKPKTGRALSDKQHQEILEILRQHEGKSITICSVESDAEGFEFAGTLKHVFEEAGWHVDGVKQVAYGSPSTGLNLAAGSFPSPEGLVTAYLAFTSAGFHVSQQLDAKLTGGQAELIVGRMQ